MKKLIFSLFLSITLFTASSQKVYFVYIQTETEKPFFVKIGNKIHSSTSAGYLILSKLIDSSYNISIGFPNTNGPEQNYSIVINKKDHGFLLKQFGDKGWGLFNLQTLAVQMDLKTIAKTELPEKKENKDVSQFTEMLSKVADDPSIKEKPVKAKVEEKKPEVVVQKVEKKEIPVVAEVEPKPDKVEKINTAEIETPKEDIKPAVVFEEKALEKNEPVVVKKEVEKVKPVEVLQKTIVEKSEPKVDIEKKEITKEEPETKKSAFESYTPSQIKKWSESSTTEGFGLIFIDDYDNGAKDTISLLIPTPKQIEIPVTKKEEVKEEKKFIEIESKGDQKKEETKLTEVNQVEATVASPKQMLSNNCTQVAEKSDFLELRKLMAAKESNEEMIDEAKLYFKTKCFTSEQIKNLSTLFLSEESKYKFFDVSYSFVADAKNFPPLQNELQDDYYINRFRAMLRN